MKRHKLIWYNIYNIIIPPSKVALRKWGTFLYGFLGGMITKESNMEKENKTQVVSVRFTDTQKSALQKLVDSGKAKTIAGAIQYLINSHMITG